MQAAAPAKTRVVPCRHCGKPIRLSHAFIQRESAIKQDQQPNPDEQLQSRVFPARCRSCHTEGIYSLSQIVDL
jgi:hypothetical protein